MIIIGYREATLQTKVFGDGFCSNCGQQGTIACTVLSKHAHVIWIPLFPIGKRMVIRCQHCGKEFKQYGDVSPVLQEQIKAFRRTQNAPFWQWIGLQLIIGFIISALITGFHETHNTKKYLESPEYKDVYCVKYEKSYSLMYIIDIRDDSIFFADNNYTTKYESDVKKLHRPEYYDSEATYVFSHTELKDMYYVEKLILTIWRNLPYSKEFLPIEDDDDEDDYYYDDEDEDDEEEDFENEEEDDTLLLTLQSNIGAP